MSLSLINYGAGQDAMHVVYDKINAAIAFINSNMNGIVPIGTVISFTGTTAPTGWNLCDGTNGTEDMRGKFTVGYDPTDSDYNAIAKSGGSKTHLLTGAESGTSAHSHSGTVVGSDTNGIVGDGKARLGANAGAGGATIGVSIANATAANASQAHENRPPYYTLAYIQRIS